MKFPSARTAINIRTLVSNPSPQLSNDSGGSCNTAWMALATMPKKTPNTTSSNRFVAKSTTKAYTPKTHKALRLSTLVVTPAGGGAPQTPRVSRATAKVAARGFKGARPLTFEVRDVRAGGCDAKEHRGCAQGARQRRDEDPCCGQYAVVDRVEAHVLRRAGECVLHLHWLFERFEAKECGPWARLYVRQGGGELLGGRFICGQTHLHRLSVFIPQILGRVFYSLHVGLRTTVKRISPLFACFTYGGAMPPQTPRVSLAVATLRRGGLRGLAPFPYLEGLHRVLSAVDGPECSHARSERVRHVRAL